MQQFRRRPGTRSIIHAPWINHKLVQHACGRFYYEAQWNGGPRNEQSIFYLDTGTVATVCPTCDQPLTAYRPLYQMHRNCDHKECRDWQRAVPEPPGGGIDTIVDYRKK